MAAPAKSPAPKEAQEYLGTVLLRQIDRLYDFECAPDVNKTVPVGEEFSFDRVRTFAGNVTAAVGDDKEMPFKKGLQKIFAIFRDGASDLVFNKESTLIDCGGDDDEAKRRISALIRSSEVGFGSRKDLYWRTFDRTKSTRIKEGYWVYVFQATSPSGDKGRLYCELQSCEGGTKLKRMHPLELAASKCNWLAQKAQAEAARQTPEPPYQTGKPLGPTPILIEKKVRDISKQAALPETVFTLPAFATDEAGNLHLGLRGEPIKAHYFFYLTPMQLPWAGIERLIGNLVGRTVRLHDAFNTDIASNAAETADKYVPFLSRQGESQKELVKREVSQRKFMWVLHLPSAFDEASARADDYAIALEIYEKHLQNDDSLPDEPRKRRKLARLVYLFTQNQADLRKSVKEKLFAELYPEADGGVDHAHLRTAVVEILIRDLVNWISTKEVKDGVAAGRSPSVADLRQAPDPAPPRCSQFSEAAEDYLYAPPETRQKACDAVIKALVNLEKWPAGQAYLYENLKANVGGKPDLKLTKRSDVSFFVPEKGKGGLELLLSLDETWGKWTAKTIDYTLKVYASPLIRLQGHYEQAVKKLITYLIPWKRTSKLTNHFLWAWMLDKDPVTGQRRSVKYREVLAAGENVTGAFGSFRAFLALIRAINELEDNPESTGPQDVIAGAADLLSASIGAANTICKNVGVLSPTLEWLSHTYVGPLGGFSSIMGMASTSEKIHRAHSSGETAGYSLQLIGSLVAFTVLLGPQGAVALLICAVAWIFNKAGEQMVLSRGDPGAFLMACAFGKGREFDDEPLENSLFTPKANYISFEKAKELKLQGKPIYGWRSRYDEMALDPDLAKWSLDVQFHELEKIVYGFDATVEVVRIHSGAMGAANRVVSCRIYLAFWYPRCLPVQWNLGLVTTTTCAGDIVNADAHIGSEGSKGTLYGRGAKETKDALYELELQGTKITIADFPWPHTRHDEILVQGSLTFSGGPNLSGRQTELKRNITICNRPDIVGVDYAKSYEIK